MNLRLRRYQNALAVSGIAVIALGIWSAIKGVLMILMDSARFFAYFDAPPASAGEWVMIIIAVVLIYGVFLVVNLFVGLAAYREGTGRKSGKVYIVLGVIMALVLLAGTITELVALFSVGPIAAPDTINAESDVSVTSLLLDLTALFALVELVVSAIRVKRLTKQVQG